MKSRCWKSDLKTENAGEKSTCQEASVERVNISGQRFEGQMIVVLEYPY